MFTSVTTVIIKLRTPIMCTLNFEKKFENLTNFFVFFVIFSSFFNIRVLPLVLNLRHNTVLPVLSKIVFSKIVFSIPKVIPTRRTAIMRTFKTKYSSVSSYPNNRISQVCEFFLQIVFRFFYQFHTL